MGRQEKGEGRRGERTGGLRGKLLRNALNAVGHLSAVSDSSSCRT